MIVVRPTSGLANRLRVISSFRVLANRTERPFVVCWGPSPGWGDERLEDLFDHSIRIISDDDFDVLTGRALNLHEVASMKGRGSERTRTWAEGTSLHQVYDRDIQVVTYAGPHRCDELLDVGDRDAVLGADFRQRYEADVRTWTPVRSIRRAVNRIARRFDDHTIGVHIRRGDAWADPTPRSPYQRSTDDAFIQAMDSALEADPDTTFFLATDGAETEERFRARYGDAIITNPKKEFIATELGEPKGNQRDAVIDMFALARTRQLISSYYSSFSKFAAVLGGIRHTDALDDDNDGADRSIEGLLRRRYRPSAVEPPHDLVACYALNHVGLGHTSRLVAVHDELRRLDAGVGSTFFVEDHRQLIADYDFRQVVIPRFHAMYRELNADEELDADRSLALGVIDLALADTRPIILHDVFVHRGLYDAAVEHDWPQALIFRARRDVRDPGAWIRDHAPAVTTLFWLGKAGLVREHTATGIYGVDDVVRRPLGDMPLWNEPFADIRIMITAGGGGRPDSGQFIAAAIDAVDAFSRRTEGSVEARIVTGPFYEGEVQLPAASAAGFTVTRYVPPTYSLYWGSSVVVAQSGYNTFTELGRTGVPQVLVPSNEFGVDDQRRRAVERIGDNKWVQVTACDATEITAALQFLTSAPPPPWEPSEPPQGAAQIARALQAMAGA